MDIPEVHVIGNRQVRVPNITGSDLTCIGLSKGRAEGRIFPPSSPRVKPRRALVVLAVILVVLQTIAS